MAEPVRKAVSDLQPGDWVIVELPCRVRVEHVKVQPGAAGRGNRRVTYTRGEVILTEDYFNIGSALSVPMSIRQGDDD